MNTRTATTWTANAYLGGSYAVDEVCPNGERVAHIAEVHGRIGETRANAHLMAAAPDLVAAVDAFGTWAINAVDFGNLDDGDRQALRELVAQAGAALAKARGES